MFNRAAEINECVDGDEVSDGLKIQNIVKGNM